MPNVVNIKEWAAAQEPIARKSFVLGLERQVYDGRDMFFDVVPSNKITETIFDLGDVGSAERWTGSVPYLSWQQNYQMTVNNYEYAKGIAIEYRFIRTDQQNVVPMASKMLGLSFHRLIVGDTWSWINNIFNTTYTTRDGLAVASTAHTSSIAGGANQSNYGTSAMTPATVASTKNAMKRFKSNAGELLEIEPDMILCSPELADTADEIVKSQYQVNSANNNINIHFGKYKVVSHVAFTDTNNWVMVDSKLMKQYVKWYQVDPVSYDRDQTFDTRVAKWAGFAFHGIGITGWEFCYANEV